MSESEVNIEVDEINLEDLIVLGEDTKIPISIEYPRKDGTVIKAKAYVKQLTLKELKGFNVNKSNLLESAMEILTKTLYKSDNTVYDMDEILVLPVGVVQALAEKILDLSGVKGQTYTNQLSAF